MKMKTLCFSLLFLSTSSYAFSFGFNIGPFNLEFDGRAAVANPRVILDDPICRAIHEQKQISVVVEGEEIINAREVKLVSKRLLIEPYAFGITENGRPVLRGNVLEEKLIKEMTVKYGEDHFDKEDIDKNDRNGFFSGWFRSEKSEVVDIRKVSDLSVISESHFNLPKNYKRWDEKNIRILCEIQ